LSVSAQSTYNRTFDFFNRSWDDALFIYKEDTLTNSTIFHGSFQNPFDTINDSLKYNQLYFAETDSIGYLKRLKHYGHNKYAYLIGDYQCTFKLNDMLYETFIVFYDTMDRYTNQVWCINITTFDTLYSITLDIPNTYIHDDMLKRNGNYYFIGNIGNTVGDRLFFLVVDSSGKQLVNKILPPSYKGSFTNMEWAGDKLLIGGFNSNETNWSNSFGWYALFDTLGNIIWEKTTTNDSFFYDVSGIEVLAGDTAYYIFSSRSESRPQYLNNYNFIGSIDITNGNIKWKKEYEFQAENPKFNSPFRYYNGSLYSIGNLLVQPGTQNEIQYATLSKYDLNGTPIWNRLFKRDNYYNRIRNLQFIGNSIFITSDARDTSEEFSDADAWIIKTDTFGCVIPGCQLFDNVPQIIAPQINYMVYPNPANNKLNFEYKSLKTFPIELAITNTLGCTIETFTINQKHTFDTSSWPSGMYILTISQNNTPIGSSKIIIQH
jgi:hypothetical protein